MEQKKHRLGKRILKTFGIIVAVLLVLVIGILTFVSVSEYRPRDIENVQAEGTADQSLKPGDTISLMSWNIGYGALGENADFFMDGGSMVRGESKEAVQTNMAGIIQTINSVNPDIFLLQETDRSSSRSYKIDEVSMIKERMNGMTSVFANNYKVSYVPYPVPPLGKIDSGVATISKYAISGSERVQLPVPFSWPIPTR